MLYVGKAKSLRKRASSYLARDHEPRLAAMVSEAVDLEYVVTDSESEALLLENNWIKSQAPALQRPAAGRQDLPLPEADDARRVPAHRLHPPDLATTAPSTSAPSCPGGLARKAIKLVQKLFQVRVCRIEVDGSWAAPVPLLRHAPLPGPLRGEAHHQGGLRRGGRAGAAVPRRADRAAAQATQAGDVGGRRGDGLRARGPAPRHPDRGRGGQPAAQALLGGRGGPRRLRRPHLGRQRGRGLADHARGAGARPPGAVLGRGGAHLPRAPALRGAAADLRPHDLHPQGDPPAGADRGGGGAGRLAVGEEGRAGLCAACPRGDRRPSG